MPDFLWMIGHTVAEISQTVFLEKLKTSLDDQTSHGITFSKLEIIEYSLVILHRCDTADMLQRRVKFYLEILSC